MKRYLILENGMIFEGKAFGASKDVIAEVVFTTAMTGYVETLTDLSYTGQAVVQTFPLIGNYGVMPEDAESGKISVSAYIVKEYCLTPSNFRSQSDLDSFLKKHGIVGMYGIDTRALTKILRRSGTMNGMITDDLNKADINAVRNYRIEKPVEKVSTKQIRRFCRNGRYRIALLDFGVKENIIRSLLKRNCDIYVLPHNTPADEILSLAPDGLFLSNGPGDPADNTEVIETLKKLLPHKIPTMGICLGHQLLALANGFRTQKLKFGHRGANHPVRDTRNGKIHITSQNHGYAVVSDSIKPDIADELFTNINDLSNEGLIYKNFPAFSVQFHPEACAGPKDTDFLFDEFIRLMEVNYAKR
ncbi:carbamoyl phosphate synthase small subunit [Thermoclostridium stercorarium subsp. thermolacticum DSM 2910]|jgi:carbamoyl-phosphate synthase small subunit|nr:carbamoyl phosphate synthase small subunit [Thermoclostridium stercorarium]AGI38867.1 carbamoyl-phosphate synthase small subunit [Thermoclostridium stercorarium subsp. stercorarium DSM 8532]ANW98236.1 carbamoyl phosphate synthase small subunit [Thermoclostridium stercorarium subsp. thermolacticum DSM 2910]ANX00766.1 carbamoyl phosphate synthase small subunit [Thermoclostridium stercorarium subsp. leptospartum DSM 9219]UZQ86380.1 carbamoyl phosphate synthase small subunit [Thermoclostridium s